MSKISDQDIKWIEKKHLNLTYVQRTIYYVRFSCSICNSSHHTRDTFTTKIAKDNYLKRYTPHRCKRKAQKSNISNINSGEYIEFINLIKECELSNL